MREGGSWSQDGQVPEPIIEEEKPWEAGRVRSLRPRTPGRVTAVVGREAPFCAVGARGEVAGLGTMGFSGAAENVTRERKMRASGKQEPPIERVARQRRATVRGHKRRGRCHLLCGLRAQSTASRTGAGGEWSAQVQKQLRFRGSRSGARFLE